MHGKMHFLSKNRMIGHGWLVMPIGAKILTDSYETIP